VSTTSDKPRIIITTAGFGDGHNSAANNLAAALTKHAEVEVIDPCDRGAPVINSYLRRFYRFITTHTPRLWAKIYKSTDKHDFSKERFPMMRKPENVLHDLLFSFEPHAIISTYPLYPYFIDRSFRRGAPKIPVFTLVTDSIEINAAWTNAPTDFWLITDPYTKEKLIESNLPKEKIIVTGFAVHPRFRKLASLPSDSSCTPFKVLYFATAKRPHVRRHLLSILNTTGAKTVVTIVLGRNVRKLYDRAREIQKEFPGRVQIKGWTRNVPELLASHHLAIGKAGGATVHEAIAAGCPMLEEEGNLELLLKIGAGQLTNANQNITDAINSLLKNNAAKWRKMKQNLEKYDTSNGSKTAAKFILKQIKELRKN